MGERNNRKFLSLLLVVLLVISIVPADSQVYALAGNRIQLNAGKTKTMETGTVFKLKVKNLPAKTGNIKYKWLSLKSSVASVTKKGVVSARKEGTAKITCTVKYSVKTGSRKVNKTNKLACKIKVVPAPDVTPAASAVPEESAMPSPEASPLPSATPVATQVPEDSIKPDTNNIV